jgi:hypothetical protein
MKFRIMIQKKVRILEILPKNDKKEIMHRRFKFKINKEGHIYFE